MLVWLEVMVIGGCRFKVGLFGEVFRIFVVT